VNRESSVSRVCTAASETGTVLINIRPTKAHISPALRPTKAHISPAPHALRHPTPTATPGPDRTKSARREESRGRPRGAPHAHRSGVRSLASATTSNASVAEPRIEHRHAHTHTTIPHLCSVQERHYTLTQYRRVGIPTHRCSVQELHSLAFMGSGADAPKSHMHRAPMLSWVQQDSQTTRCSSTFARPKPISHPHRTRSATAADEPLPEHPLPPVLILRHLIVRRNSLETLAQRA